MGIHLGADSIFVLGVICQVSFFEESKNGNQFEKCEILEKKHLFVSLDYIKVACLVLGFFYLPSVYPFLYIFSLDRFYVTR
ncbi:hypothetical protein D0T87_02280 [Bacteroides sp. 51]|nr:hypothetical protein [Bacteroides sp. 51]